MKKKIALLGSTGSIGTQTLEVIDEFSDDFQVSLLSTIKMVNFKNRLSNIIQR